MLGEAEQTLPASGASAYRVAELRISRIAVLDGHRARASIADAFYQPLISISHRFFNLLMFTMSMSEDLLCDTFDQPIVFIGGTAV